MADKLSSGIFISEILADNAGNTAVDVDGDGRANKADEFVEIQNTSGNTIDLSGYQIWSGQNGLLHTFQPGATLAPGETATVLGEYTGTPAPGFYGATNPNGTPANSNNVNWLEDGENQKFDSIFLYDPSSGEYVVISYGDPPRAPTPPSGFPSGATRVGDGESINSNAPNGTAFARDGNGTLVETTPTPGSPDVPCFVAGTLVDTPSGLRPVQYLRPGDWVTTRDHGPVQLQAVSSTRLSRADLLRNPDMRPVRFATGAIGNTRPFALSPQHRVLMVSDASEMLFGARETLVSARHFIGQKGVELCCDLPPVEYFHLLFERHEILRAAGVWTESLFMGDIAERLVARADAWRLRPGLQLCNITHDATARPILRQFEAQVLLARDVRQSSMR